MYSCGVLVLYRGSVSDLFTDDNLNKSVEVIS